VLGWIPLSSPLLDPGFDFKFFSASSWPGHSCGLRASLPVARFSLWVEAGSFSLFGLNLGFPLVIFVHCLD
jgi:hypothetical protein